MRGPVSSSIVHRRPDSHKGDYGHLLVIGGAVGMTGAPVLCAEAALRSGAGLVSLAVPRVIYPIVARKAPAEIMVHPFSHLSDLLKRSDVIAIGPGLSQSPPARRLARRLVAIAKVPLVLDADGINAFAGPSRVLLRKAKGPVVITPHPGEMARLLGITAAAVQKDRTGVAKKSAKQLGVTVVLKGHRTVVASPLGKVYINRTGNPGMATGGAGDVLTGVIAALIGQGCEPFTAAKAGVYLHGLAGDSAAQKVGQVSLTAGDLLDHLPAAFRYSLR